MPKIFGERFFKICINKNLPDNVKINYCSQAMCTSTNKENKCKHY